jgi:hypothetical protein
MPRTIDLGGLVISWTRGGQNLEGRRISNLSITINYPSILHFPFASRTMAVEKTEGQKLFWMHAVGKLQ